jgi:hypothetical protein
MQSESVFTKFVEVLCVAHSSQNPHTQRLLRRFSALKIDFFLHNYADFVLHQNANFVTVPGKKAPVQALPASKFLWQGFLRPHLLLVFPCSGQESWSRGIGFSIVCSISAALQL